MMLENNELTLEDVTESKVSKPMKTASPRSSSTDSLGAEVEHERREVLAKFKEFNEKAKKAELAAAIGRHEAIEGLMRYSAAVIKIDESE